MPRVLLVRGHLVTPWELRPWRELPERFDVAYLRTASNAFDASSLDLRAVPVRSLRDRLPRGRAGDALALLAGDRYLGVDGALAQADVVHAEELGYWFAADVARRKARHRYRLVQTVWETLPLLEAYRNAPARRHRRAVLEHTDLFLAATERARDALLLEGVEPARIEVCPPGIDTARFAAAARAAPPPAEHVILSPGRLVWEKGHQDVLRAVAWLRREGHRPRVLLTGRGPEEGRLRAHAAELGVADALEIRSVPYDEMPAVFAGASCLVLASLPLAGSALHPFDVPRAFWEEQFGMVLAEGMAAGLDLLVSSSGAIPEVVGDEARLFAPGDWRAVARLLADGPLARPPAARVEHDPERIERHSTAAMARRLAAAYDRVLAAG